MELLFGNTKPSKGCTGREIVESLFQRRTWSLVCVCEVEMEKEIEEGGVRDSEIARNGLGTAARSIFSPEGGRAISLISL